MNQTILAIDIGSSKICAIVATIRDNVPHIIGVGRQRSQGIKNGLIVNIDQASRAIKAAVAEARRESAASEMVNKAIISISGAYTKSVISSGVCNVMEQEISIKEISKALDNAVYNVAIPGEFDKIHVLPYAFRLDKQDHIEDPMGMTGHRLEVFTHIVTAQRSALENLRKTIKLAGIEIQNIVLSAYASSIAVLSDDEKDLGVACIDIGGSTCEIMIHDGNAMRYNAFFGVGSNHITNDLAIALSTKTAAAEEVKIRFGALDMDFQNANMQGETDVKLPSVGADDETHHVPLSKVQEIIQARVVETFMVLAKRIENSELKHRLGAGVVLTGGMMNMQGIQEVAKMLFRDIPVRISKTIEIPGLYDELRDPAYSTALGLVLYGAGKCANYERDSTGKIYHKEAKSIDEIGDLFTPPPYHGGNYQNVVDTDLSNLKDELAQGEKVDVNIRAEEQNGVVAKMKKKLAEVADKFF